MNGAGVRAARGWRVLVVEDEPVIGMFTAKSIQRMGMECDTAGDGQEALEKLRSAHYDAVVTDLRMPKMHGYALANELLGWPKRPVIIVVTGVMEPRLACQLLERGVDDIVFKPTETTVLAAKVAALLRLRDQRQTLNSGDEALASPSSHSADQRLTASQMKGDLQRCTSMPLVSQAALDLYLLTREEQYSARHAAAVIARDPRLGPIVVQLSNIAFFNPSGRRVVDVENAITLIGQNRIGELILGMQLLSTISANLPKWIEVEWLRQRSLAAAIAADWLVRHGDPQTQHAGIVLGSIVHQLGRFLLAALYPQHYEHALEQCKERKQSLVDLEQQLFPIPPSSALAWVLAASGVPKEDCEPLAHTSKTYSALEEVPAPIRRRAELLKMSAFIGAIAVAQWKPWDCIEPPPPSISASLPVPALDTVVRVVQTGVVTRKSSDNPRWILHDPKRCARTEPRHITYFNLSPGMVDFLGAIASGLGFTLTRGEVLAEEPTALVNCCDADRSAVEAAECDAAWAGQLVAVQIEPPEAAPIGQRAIFMPCAFAELDELLHLAATAGSWPGHPKTARPPHMSGDFGDFVHA